MDGGLPQAGRVKLFTAFYDFAYGPISYDLTNWLISALVRMEDAGCDRLHVVFVPKEDGLGGFARHWGKHDEAATRWRLWNLAVQLVPLAGATLTVAASRDQAMRLAGGAWWWPEEKAHFPLELVELARRGRKLPQLQPTDAAVRYIQQGVRSNAHQLVTLTLRNNSTSPERNSRRTDWFRMTEWLQSAGYGVIVLEDTEDALNNGRAYGAEYSPDLRLALYKRAAMNIIGNNGPCGLLYYSGAPYLQMCGALPREYEAHWLKYLGLRVGDQWPWANANQRIVYKLDTFDAMREAFSAWASATNSWPQAKPAPTTAAPAAA